MAPTTRSSLKKNVIAKASISKQKKKDKRVPPKRTRAKCTNSFPDGSSDDDGSTDSEMEELVRQTAVRMMENAKGNVQYAHTPNAKGHKVDSEVLKIESVESRQMVGRTSASKNDDTLPLVVDSDPNSKSGIRLKVKDRSSRRPTRKNVETLISKLETVPATTTGTRYIISGNSITQNEKIDDNDPDPVQSDFIDGVEETVQTSKPTAVEKDFLSLDGEAIEDRESKQKTSGDLIKIQSSRWQEIVEVPTVLDAGIDLDDTYLDFGARKPNESKKMSAQMIVMESNKDKLLKKSVVTPEFDKRHSVPAYKESMRQMQKRKKRERESCTGSDWYNMAAVEMTPELRNDIKVLRMRSTLDRKRFYKHNDMTAMPKFVQVGTIVESPADFYHSRIPKKQRKQTIVDELLADAETRRYNRKKYMELQERSQRLNRRKKSSKKGR